MLEQSTPPLEIIDGETHYMVEEVLNTQLQNGRLEFLIKWEGYGYEENSWEVEGDVKAPRKVQEFYQKKPQISSSDQILCYECHPFITSNLWYLWNTLDLTPGTPALWTISGLRTTFPISIL